MTTDTSGNDRDVFALRENDATGTIHRGVYEHNGGTRRMRYYRNGGGSSTFLDKTGNIGDSNWFYWTYTSNFSSGAISLRKNADTAVTGTRSGNAVSPGGTTIFTLGSSQEYSYTRPLTGLLDEVRVQKGVISNDWITTEYNNQSDEAGFWGTWSTVGGKRGAIAAFF
jgi:hypothetical protein